MNVGVSVPLPAYLVDPGLMAKKAEELGFESFFCAEHPFMPVKTTSRFAGSPDGVIPETYAHFVDPFVTLARASGMTSRIKLATGIVLVPERHPPLLAKEISTLDRLAKDAGRDPARLTISVFGQPPDRDLIRRYLDAGATRVIVRPESVKTDAEMAAQLTRIAEAVLR